MTSLRGRLRGSYRTSLGAMKPHPGGWGLKTLSVLDELWVHYAPTPGFKTAKKKTLREFAHACRSRAGRHCTTRSE